MDAQSIVASVGGLSILGLFSFIGVKSFLSLKKDITVDLDLQNPKDKARLKTLFAKSFSNLKENDQVFWSAGGMDKELYGPLVPYIEDAVTNKNVKFTWLCGPEVVVNDDISEKQIKIDMETKKLVIGISDKIDWSDVNPILGLAQKYPRKCEVIYDKINFPKSRWHFVFPEKSAAFYFIEEPHELGDPRKGKFSNSISPEIKTRLASFWKKSINSKTIIPENSFINELLFYKLEPTLPLNQFL